MALRYQIARTVVRDHFRTARPSATVPLTEADPVEETDPRTEIRCGACQWVDELVGTLPDGYREAVRLSEIEALSQQEVADRLGLSLSSAKSRVQRGRAMLKGMLEDCCRFEFDARSNVTDYDPKPDRTVCRDCGE